MTATLRAFLVNSSRALGVEPQHLKDPAADGDVQTALLKDVIALREAGDADRSLLLLEAAMEAGLVSDWVESNRARALLALGREQEALPLLELLSACGTEAVAASAKELLLEHWKQTSPSDGDAEGEQEEPAVEGEEEQETLIANDRPIDHFFTNSHRSVSAINQQEFSSIEEKFSSLFALGRQESHCDFSLIDAYLQHASDRDLHHTVLEQAIALRETGHFQESIMILDCAWQAGIQSEWIIDNKVRVLLSLGDVESASSLLQFLQPDETQEHLRKAINDHQDEIAKIKSYFANYANADYLRKRYFSLKNKTEYASVRKPQASVDQCLALAIKFREASKTEQSLLVLLLTSVEADYNPWIEDNFARLACKSEDWKSANQHWKNIVSRSSDINATETAVEALQSLVLSGELGNQDIVEKFGHLLFEEACLNFQKNGEKIFDSHEFAKRFWAFDHSVDQYLTREINPFVWQDFAGDDLRHAARYLLRNKLFHGLSFLWAIVQDGGIKVSAMKARCFDYFNQEFYFEQRKDLDPSQFNALEHFLEFGWKENTDPTTNFSCQQYLSSCDVCQLNPFYHYLCYEVLPKGYLNGVNISDDDAEALVRNFNKGSLLTSGNVELNCQASAAQNFQDSPYFDPSKLWLIQSAFGDYQSLKIHFVIPDFSKGGGGHMTIFRMIRHLEEKGHHVWVWVINPERSNHSADLREDVVKYFQPIRAKVLPLDSSFHYASGDCIIATGWQTVDFVRKSEGFQAHYYFIQDYEPYFYARGTSSVLAEHTYQYDLACICASPWLEKLMTEKFQRWSRFLWLAYDHNIYKTSQKKIQSKYQELNADRYTVHIAVYARCHTERRCVELALESLEQLSKLNSDFVVHFFGDEDLDINPSYKAVNYGILDHEQLAELYQFCTIGLSFSATNYSLLPQEMMAAGLPVFDLNVESTRAIYPENVIQLMAPCAQSIAKTLNHYSRDPQLLQQQALAAYEWVVQFSWERAGDDFEKALIERLSERNTHQTKNTYSIEKIHQNSHNDHVKPYKASIVIPTYNAGHLLERVLEAIEGQQAPWDFQCLIIDSGSQDETLQICNKFSDRLPALDLYQIPKGEFQHGYTRNVGVDLSNSEFVAFITQDAIPANDKWLYNLVNALESSPNAAGAFGRHVAHDDADPFTHQELKNHFKGFDQLPVVMSLTTDRESVVEDAEGWRKILHFYSDNNSCLRKSVWRSLPLPCVPYGEDQLWADMVIRNGYEKLYVRDAVVKHSHDYDSNETFERAVTESKFFSSCFGYDFHKQIQSAYNGISADLQNVLKEGKQLGCSNVQMIQRSSNVYAKHLGWLSGAGKELN